MYKVNLSSGIRVPNAFFAPYPGPREILLFSNEEVVDENRFILGLIKARNEGIALATASIFNEEQAQKKRFTYFIFI